MFNLSNKVAEINVSYQPANSICPKITSAADARDHLLKFFPEDTIALYERFVVGYLNRSNKLLGVYEVSKGGITSTVVDIRLILSVALKTAATGIILAHNHPSGNLKASENDKFITEKIDQACKLMDIKLMDHVIFSPNHSFLSFAEENIL